MSIAIRRVVDRREAATDNQSVVTQFFQELTQSNSTLVARTSGRPNIVTETYEIDMTPLFSNHPNPTNEHLNSTNT